MAQVPSGTIFSIGSAYGSAKATTVVTNASEAVVTSAAHGYSVGDFVEMTSGWGRMNRRVFRIKTVTTDTFTLELCDTTSTTFYPAGAGLGTVRKVTTFTQITKVLSVGGQGGTPKNVTYKYMENDVDFNINDGFQATSKDLTLDADAIGTAGYTALLSLTEVQTDTVLKIVSKSGAVQLVPCTVALNEDVQMQDGQINRIVASFAGNNRAVRYAA
jgi:hypothetical protein